MRSFLKLWFKSAKLQIARRMAYRGEYFISLIAMFILELIGPLLIFIIYFNSEGFPGWTFYEVLLVQGILLTVKGFSFFSFAGIIWNSNVTLMRGEFDIVLLKPRNTLLMFICESFDAEDIAKFIGGLLITTYALIHINGITLVGIGLMIALMILGVGFYFIIALLASSFVFRFIRTFRIYEVMDIFELVGRYPKSIYPKAFGTLFTTLIPIFIIAVFPANALLGRLSIDMVFASVSIILLIFISLKIWFATIRRYASAGG